VHSLFVWLGLRARRGNRRGPGHPWLGGRGGAAGRPPTPAPWKVQRAGESIWIAGPQVSGDTVLAAKDRRIVCEFRLFGDDALDAETEANFALIVERVNGAER
jgi:hypothetical protein